MIRSERERLIGSLQSGKVLTAAKPQAGNRDPKIRALGHQSARFIEFASCIRQLPLRGRPFRFRQQRPKTQTISRLGVHARLRGCLAPASCEEQRKSEP